jgi:inhibitor of cysteine peptidase
MSRRVLIVLVVIAVVLLIFFLTREGNNEPEIIIDGDTIRSTAVVDEIDTIVLGTEPAEVRVIASGNLPDGCTSIENIEQSIEGNDFSVKIKTVRPKDEICTDALVPFTENIALNVLSLPAGTYNVDVNGVIDSFDLLEDNIPAGK